MFVTQQQDEGTGEPHLPHASARTGSCETPPIVYRM